MNFIPQNVRITKIWSMGNPIKNSKMDNYFYVQTSDNYEYFGIWSYHKVCTFWVVSSLNDFQTLR